MNLSLSSFKPKTALTYLLIFFVFGIALTIFNCTPYITVSLLVFIYTLILIKVQNYHEIQLSSFIKDSPYFLGFLFNIVVISNSFIIVAKYGSDNALILKNLLPQIGTALFTTITGLLCRHCILSLDPNEENEQSSYVNMLELLKAGTNKFDAYQSKLIQLIESFINTHKKLLNEEKIAVTQHIEMISKSIEIFSDVEKSYPDRIKLFTESIDTIQERINNLSDELLDYSKNLNSPIDSIKIDISKVFDDLKKRITESNQLITESNKIISKSNNETSTTITTVINTVNEYHDDIARHLSLYKAEIISISEIIEGFIKASKGNWNVK